MKKTPSGFSITMVKETIINFFTNNRSLAGSVSKWTATNTIEALTKNSLNTPLTNFEKQNNFASHLNNS